MQRFKVIGNDDGPRNLNGDFRSLGSSGIFEALPGSRYGSSVDLTGETTGAKPRALPRALQPKTVKTPQQQQRSSSYRHPVVALPPPRVPVTRELAASSESAEERRRQGYGGNHDDRSLSNRQNFGSHILLASKPNSIIQNTRRNSESTFGHVTPITTTTTTPGTAQANTQSQWIERVLKEGGSDRPPRVKAERENRTERNNDVVGYRSVPLSNFRNRRNSSSDVDPMSKSSSSQSASYVTNATISLPKPRITRYGSLFDLSMNRGPTTEAGGRQTGSDVIGHGLLPKSSSGIRRNGTSAFSKEPDEEPVFSSSSFSSSSSNAREYGNPDTSGSGGHVTGSTWNRGFDASERTSGTPVVVKRTENWNKTENATSGDVTAARPINDDHLTYGTGLSSSPAFRSRKFSFDQILPQKENDFRSYSTSRGPVMTSSSGPMKPQAAKGGPAPWARPFAAVPGSFRERSQSITTLNRYPRGGDVDSSTALLALRSSRYPSAQMTPDDCEGDSMTMSASERVASSPWAAARATAPSESGEKNMDHHHHYHQSLDQFVSSRPTNFPVEPRLESSVKSNFEEVDDVINRRQYSSVSRAPVTSEATGNRDDRFLSTAPPPAHDVIGYSTAPSHVASSLYDVRGEDSFIISASEKSMAHRPKENSNLDTGIIS